MEHAELRNTAEKNILYFGSSSVAQSPWLTEAVQVAEHHPEFVLRQFAAYDMVVRDLFDLNESEREIVRQVNKKLEKPRGADAFLRALSPYKDTITSLVHSLGDLRDKPMRYGIGELTTMMENAANIRKSDPNWKPTDGDPKSDSVIWGFVNGATNPEINIHFTLCHGIERTVTERLKDRGVVSPYINHKDWLVSAMTDVVALRGLQGKFPENKLIPLWRPRRPNGLGWVSDQRIVAYQELGIGR